MAKMDLYAELHCHTRYSDGLASPEDCVRSASRKNLQILAITDHDTAQGGLPYWEAPIQHGVLVIPGEEISTDLGHVLAYFVRKTIKPGPFIEVLGEIQKQNALAFMAHPFHIPLGNLWRKKQIFKMSESQIKLLTGLEVENGHNRSSANQMAVKLAQEMSLPAIAGSDAHFPFEIGNVRTRLRVDELTHDSIYEALSSWQALSVFPRKLNAYPVYLFIGMLNRFFGRRYIFNAKINQRIEK